MSFTSAWQRTSFACKYFGGASASPTREDQREVARRSRLYFSIQILICETALASRACDGSIYATGGESTGGLPGLLSTDACSVPSRSSDGHVDPRSDEFPRHARHRVMRNTARMFDSRCVVRSGAIFASICTAAPLRRSYGRPRSDAAYGGEDEVGLHARTVVQLVQPTPMLFPAFSIGCLERCQSIDPAEDAPTGPATDPLLEARALRGVGRPRDHRAAIAIDQKLSCSGGRAAMTAGSGPPRTSSRGCATGARPFIQVSPPASPSHGHWMACPCCRIRSMP